MIKLTKISKVICFLFLSVFLLSEVAMVVPLAATANATTNQQFQLPNNQILSMGPQQGMNSASVPVNLKTSLDQALFNWVNSSIPLNPNQYRTEGNNNPVISLFAPPGASLQNINQYMHIDSFVDLGMYGFIVMGSVSSVFNLVSLVRNDPLVKISSDPYDSYLSSLTANNVNTQQISNSPNQFVSNNLMGVNQANTMNCGSSTFISCNGTGVTIAMVDGGTDFGNSDLSNASALDSNGLPTSFDTEGWSLVATPLKVGTDIPISSDNTTLLFSEVPSATMDKLQINDPGNVAVNGFAQLDLSRGWEYWHNQQNFMSPQNWKINPSWIDQPGQAPPKFGIGVEQWKDITTEKVYLGYFYALLIDLNHDGKYDSVVIDMATSAWATYVKYIADGGSATPLSQIYPDFNFANDKVVTWETNAQRIANGGTNAIGSDYTFAIDWNGDGVNDWSYGSMANAYNRWGFLPINQTDNGKIVHGVDPTGSGFVAYYPFGYGFAEHGTFTSSVAVSRGLVNYNVFSNNTGSWDYPYGNSSTRTLPGAASGANLMSVSFGATPQDELLAWLWSAGFNLNTTRSTNTADITGAEWSWSGHVRANITSNSWGIGGLYWGGFWGTDWISDLLSMPHLGGNQTYIRKITDVWAADVMTGTTSGSTAKSVDYTKPFVPFTSTATTTYIGANNPYVGVGLNVTIPSASALTISAEYYNGVQWKALTTNTTLSLTTNGITWLEFAKPPDWNLASFTQGGKQLYWVRLTENNGASTLQISNILFQFINSYYNYPGMLMVVAAGNDNYYQSTASPFGSLTMKVGASSSSDAYANTFGADWNVTSDQMAFFSSAGPKANGVPGVDIVSPGYFVYSGTPLYHSVINNHDGPGIVTTYGGNGNNAYVIWAGTSAATPAISGVAAIAYQAYIAKHPGVTVNPNLIKQIMKSTATNLYYPSNIQGAGFVNASAIVDYILYPNTTKYFVMGSNTTYEDQLNISSWLSNIGSFYWYYAYSAGDPMADPYDFPVSTSSLLAQPHSDVDLSTNTITRGTIVNTKVTVNTNDLNGYTVTAVHPVLTSTVNKSVTLTNTDQFKGPKGDYVINISLAKMDIYNADFVEITVTNLNDFNNVSFDVWHDYNNDGNLQMATPSNHNGEIAKVQYDYTNYEQGYGVLQIGNPGQYNTSYYTPFLILRGNPKLKDVYSPNWASGEKIVISVKTYKMYDTWNAITTSKLTTTNGVSTWNVSINTTSMQAGYNLGFLKFSNVNNTEYMPLSVKVGFGQIDQTNPATNPKATPTDIGTYILPREGSTYQIGFQDGSMIWVPFAVDESKTTTSDVLAIRVTQVAGNNASLGFVLHYDETPNYFDSNWFQIFESQYNTGTVNGSNVNWQYIPWSSVGFEKGAYISRFGYFRYQSTSTEHIVQYRIGLFTTNATSPVSVKLEMYWLPKMPVIYSTGSTTSQYGSYCQTSFSGTCLEQTNIIFGPNANLDFSSVCNPCDPNLQSTDVTVVMGVQKATTDLTTGPFKYGYNPSYSIDYWQKRYFNAGDLVEFNLFPTNALATFEVFIYSPNTISLFNQTLLNNLPVTDLSVLALADYNFLNTGSFIASTSGYYWFGIDNYGNTNTNWVLYTKASGGTLHDLGTNTAQINTQTDIKDGFGISAEATYNIQTGMYDNVTDLVIGANTPTGLPNGLVSLNVAVDNYVAPNITLGKLALKLNGTTVAKSQGKINFDWTVTDKNGNSAISQIYFIGPSTNDFYQSTTSSTTYTWNFPSNIDIGWWTIMIFGNDAGDPTNIVNGTNYGGPGFPAYFKILILNTGGNSSLFGPLGNTIFNILIGAVGVSAVVLIYSRRTWLKGKYHNLKFNVKYEMNKRKQKPKEGPKEGLTDNITKGPKE